MGESEPRAAGSADQEVARHMTEQNTSRAVLEAHFAETFPDALDLTPKQIVAIYEAGRKRGSDEATDHEWGIRTRGDWLEGLHDELVWSIDYLNSDDARAAWWQAFRRAAGE